MSGTKIVVLHIKQLVRSAIFTVFGLAVLIAIIYIFMPKHKSSIESSSSYLYIPGKYEAQIELNNSPVVVEVSVDEDSILDINLKELMPTQAVFYPLLKPAMQQLADTIVETQTVDVPTNEDYSVTSDLLISAIKMALAQASNSESTM